MRSGIRRFWASSRHRNAGARPSRRLSLLLPLLAIAIPLPLDAAPPVGSPLAPKSFGPWVIAATTDRNGVFNGCAADRQLPNLNFGFRRTDKGLDLLLRSGRWTLAENATYPVLLGGTSSVDKRVLGRAVRPDRIEFSLGDSDRAAGLVRAAGSMLEVRAASATLQLPIESVEPMLTALDSCWNEARKAAENPFVAVSTGYSSTAGDMTAEGLVEEPTFFDAEIEGEIFRLEGLVVKAADARGPLPVVLITHGTTTDPGEVPAMRASTLLPQARDFAHRGYLAVVVVRRGYGLSQGPARPTVTSCSRPRFLKGFDADASELQAVLDLVRQRGDAAPDRTIAVGVSGGGGAVLALAARNPPGLAGVVNISGGLNLIREDGSHCSIAGDLRSAFSELGARTKIPSLWIYAQNDSFFAPDLVDDLHRSYRAAGGDADLQMLPPIGANGHDIFATAQGRYHWLPRLDGFLRQRHLPTWDAAEANAVMQAGHLDASQRNWIDRYLSAPTHKALVAARSGQGVRLRFGQSDGAGARAAALADCEATFDEPCIVLMENFDLRASVANKTAALLGPSER